MIRKRAYGQLKAYLVKNNVGFIRPCFFLYDLFDFTNKINKQFSLSCKKMHKILARIFKHEYKTEKLF